jgi:type VI secretion system protein ImpK
MESVRMSDNPFSEPGEQDRTVIRPMPGGSRAASRPPAPKPAAPSPAAATAAGPDIDAIPAGDGPLAIAAAPLLILLARLRNTATAPDPGDMRERTRRELRAFERRAKEAGVPMEQMRLAHYAMCASLDDVVLNTPWGTQGRWREEPLAVALHDDERSGEGFFDQLRTLRKDLAPGMPVIELMFICLSLGMMGPYRTAPDGPEKLERVRHQVFGLIEGAPAASGVAPISGGAALAPGAEGVEVPRPPRGGLPVWVAGSAALAVLAGIYVWSLTSLNAASDAYYEAAASAPPATMPALVRPPATPPPPPPPEPAAPGPAERMRADLADIAGVEVIGAPAATTIRIPASALFPATGATLSGGPLIERLVQVLRQEPGAIRVLAFTDNQPTRTVAFPSRFALTAARAAAVRAALARALPEPARITSDGRAESDPLAPNTTPEGRETNRRIEIVLPRQP